jgi:hypothetical protein
MPGALRSKNTTHVQLPPWEYISGQTLTMDGSNQLLTIPSTASIVEIDAEGAAVYYAINSPIASAVSPGYVPSEGGRIIGPLSILTQISIFGTAAGAAVAHIQYFREV